MPKRKSNSALDTRCDECGSRSVNSFQRTRYPGTFGFACVPCGNMWIVDTNSILDEKSVPPVQRFTKYVIRRRYVGPQPPLTPGIPTGC